MLGKIWNRIVGSVSTGSNNFKLVVVQDDKMTQKNMKKIVDALASRGHKIELVSFEDGEDLSKHLKKIRNNHSQTPDAFILDVNGSGPSMGRDIIEWFGKYRPDADLPPVNFLSMDESMATHAASTLGAWNNGVSTNIVTKDEVLWLAARIKDGKENKSPDEDGFLPYSFALRKLVHDQFGIDVFLGHRDNYTKRLAEEAQEPNERILNNWENLDMPPEEVLSRLRPYIENIRTSLESGLFRMGSEAENISDCDAYFYDHSGMPVKGKVVFSVEAVENWPANEKSRPVLVMQSYDPSVVPLLGEGVLGGLIVTDPYLASHLKFLCDANLVSGVFGLMPQGEKTTSRDFNEFAKSENPPFFEGGPVTINGLEIEEGQEVIIGANGNGVVLEDYIVSQISIAPNEGRRDIGNNISTQERAAWNAVVNILFAFEDFFKNHGEVKHHLVKANVDSALNPLLEKADAIGLIRSEQMAASNPLQSETLRAVMLQKGDADYEALQHRIENDLNDLFYKLDFDKPVKVRLFDLNPSELMGKEEQREFRRLYGKPELHGGDALEAWPELYRTQIRAILTQYKDFADRDSTIQIMMPSVKTEADVLAVKAMVEEEAQKIDIGALAMQFGVMIETLESCTNAEAIVKHCDFISFGTNDLTQQITNIQRGDLARRADYADTHGFDPYKNLTVDVWKKIEEVSFIAKEVNPSIEIDICGGQAADYETALRLFDSGVDNISVAPTYENLNLLKLRLAYHDFDQSEIGQSMQNAAGAKRCWGKTL